MFWWSDDFFFLSRVVKEHKDIAVQITDKTNFRHGGRKSGMWASRGLGEGFFEVSSVRNGEIFFARYARDPPENLRGGVTSRGSKICFVRDLYLRPLAGSNHDFSF